MKPNLNFIFSGFKFLRLAVNSGNRNPMAVGMATNIAAIGDGEWLEFPYGESDYWQQDKKGLWKKFKQIFLKPQAEKMVAAINSERRGKGTNWRGLPIYVGHPDADPQRWPDDRRLGGILELEAGADRMRLRVAWNDVGEKNRDEGYYVYPSPAWLYDERLALNTGRIIPDELRSVGLTNTPRVPNSPAWTNTDPGAGDASLFNSNNPVNAGNQNPKEGTHTMEKNHRDMLLNLLKKHHAPDLKDEATNEDIETAYNSAMQKSPVATNASPLKLKVGESEFTLNLQGEAPSDLLTRITAINTEHGTFKSERDQAVNARDTFKSDADKFRKIAMNSLLDVALNAGRITAAERATFETEFATNFDDAATKLDGKKKAALNTDRLNLRPTDGSFDLTTPHGRQIAFNTKLDEYQRPVTQGGKGFKNIDDALAAMRGDQECAPILAAMNQK